MTTGFYSKFRTHLIVYLDLVIRGLIAFVIVGIGLSIILIGYLKMKFIFILPIIFICSILISPFLSKIKLAEKLIKKYENWLNKTFFKEKK